MAEIRPRAESETNAKMESTLSQGLQLIKPHLVEAWDLETDSPKFAFTSMIWEANGEFYHHEHDQPEFEITPDAIGELSKKAVLISHDYYLGKLPAAPATCARTTSLSDSNIYFKKITPFTYRLGERHLPAHDLAHEMEVCEKLKNHHHPNICRYLGYVPTTDGSHLLGLCFERHETSLVRAAENKREFDASTVIEGISCGLKHLHSLRYVHNDMNPHNVVLAKNNTPVIIDVDSCHEIGASLKGKKAGTIDRDHKNQFSEPANEFYGLQQMREWLIRLVMQRS
ncbi:hypothetical protein B0H16DRAFT_1687153 [Mycena metata]|uniref:Protein kinase domain-containing protein n=1 Tax=Mycena metata TaxID=1033252 RepID=A0AAD7JNF2_9AGAR|nr:hypothetical protein B0H16DRAFT_1687153 [Mycena metata]